jgi:outer membrane autotransporter protein
MLSNANLEKLLIESRLSDVALAPHQWNLWSTSFGDFVNVDNGPGTARGFSFKTGGVLFGSDYTLSLGKDNTTLVGVYGGYNHTWTSLQQGFGADASAFQLGGYGTCRSGGWYFDGQVLAGFYDFGETRHALAGNASGNTNGMQLSGTFTAGYDVHRNDWTLGPFVSLQYTHVTIDGFNEHGSVAPFDISGGSTDSYRSDVGIKVERAIRVKSARIRPNLCMAWEHESGYTSIPVTANLSGAHGAQATYYSPHLGRDAAVVHVGVDVDFNDRWSAGIEYDGILGRQHYSSQAISANLNFKF